MPYYHEWKNGKKSEGPRMGYNIAPTPRPGPTLVSQFTDAELQRKLEAAVRFFGWYKLTVDDLTGSSLEALIEKNGFVKVANWARFTHDEMFLSLDANRKIAPEKALEISHRRMEEYHLK